MLPETRGFHRCFQRGSSGHPIPGCTAHGDGKWQKKKMLGSIFLLSGWGQHMWAGHQPYRPFTTYNTKSHKNPTQIPLNPLWLILQLTLKNPKLTKSSLNHHSITIISHEIISLFIFQPCSQHFWAFQPGMPIFFSNVPSLGQALPATCLLEVVHGICTSQFLLYHIVYPIGSMVLEYLPTFTPKITQM